MGNLQLKKEQIINKTLMEVGAIEQDDITADDAKTIENIDHIRQKLKASWEKNDVDRVFNDFDDFKKEAQKRLDELPSMEDFYEHIADM